MKTPYSKSSIDWTVILKALADESRLQIIHELLKGDSSVTSLSDVLGIRIYNISRHLKVLENSRLVTKRKDGNSRIYSITEDLMHRYSRKEQVLDLGCCKFTFKGLSK
ncbi:MAG: metalloregulator ArsR/SmtB family transcription factor [Nitrospirota bacterium]